MTNPNGPKEDETIEPLFDPEDPPPGGIDALLRFDDDEATVFDEPRIAADAQGASDSTVRQICRTMDELFVAPESGIIATEEGLILDMSSGVSLGNPSDAGINLGSIDEEEVDERILKFPLNPDDPTAA